MKLILLCLLSFLFCSLAQAELPKSLKICDDGEEWPPYVYYKRINNEKSKEVVGYSVDYLKRVLEPKGISFTIDLIPWKSCLDALKAGKYDMTLNASFNAERNRFYLVTRAYYALSPAYFFDKSEPSPNIQKREDLEKYKLCGVKGYNYQAGFLLSVSQLDMSSIGISQAFAKLKKHECQIVPERLEIILAYKKFGIVDYESLGLGYELIPGGEPIPFHILISRSPSYANELVEFINKRIKDINSQNKAGDLSARYSIPGLLPK